MSPSHSFQYSINCSIYEQIQLHKSLDAEIAAIEASILQQKRATSKLPPARSALKRYGAADLMSAVDVAKNKFIKELQDELQRAQTAEGVLNTETKELRRDINQLRRRTVALNDMYLRRKNETDQAAVQLAVLYEKANACVEATGVLRQQGAELASQEDEAVAQFSWDRDAIVAEVTRLVTGVDTRPVSYRDESLHGQLWGGLTPQQEDDARRAIAEMDAKIAQMNEEAASEAVLLSECEAAFESMSRATEQPILLRVPIASPSPLHSMLDAASPWGTASDSKCSDPASDPSLLQLTTTRIDVDVALAAYRQQEEVMEDLAVDISRVQGEAEGWEHSAAGLMADVEAAKRAEERRIASLGVAELRQNLKGLRRLVVDEEAKIAHLEGELSSLAPAVADLGSMLVAELPTQRPTEGGVEVAPGSVRSVRSIDAIRRGLDSSVGTVQPLQCMHHCGGAGDVCATDILDVAGTHVPHNPRQQKSPNSGSMTAGLRFLPKAASKARVITSVDTRAAVSYTGVTTASGGKTDDGEHLHDDDGDDGTLPVPTGRSDASSVHTMTSDCDTQPRVSVSTEHLNTTDFAAALVQRAQELAAAKPRQKLSASVPVLSLHETPSPVPELSLPPRPPPHARLGGLGATMHAHADVAAGAAMPRTSLQALSGSADISTSSAVMLNGAAGIRSDDLALAFGVVQKRLRAVMTEIHALAVHEDAGRHVMRSLQQHQDNTAQSFVGDGSIDITSLLGCLALPSPSVGADPDGSDHSFVIEPPALDDAGPTVAGRSSSSGTNPFRFNTTPGSASGNTHPNTGHCTVDTGRSSIGLASSRTPVGQKTLTSRSRRSSAGDASSISHGSYSMLSRPSSAAAALLGTGPGSALPGLEAKLHMLRRARRASLSSVVDGMPTLAQGPAGSLLLLETVDGKPEGPLQVVPRKGTIYQALDDARATKMNALMARLASGGANAGDSMAGGMARRNSHSGSVGAASEAARGVTGSSNCASPRPGMLRRRSTSHASCGGGPVASMFDANASFASLTPLIMASHVSPSHALNAARRSSLAHEAKTVADAGNALMNDFSGIEATHRSASPPTTPSAAARPAPQLVTSIRVGDHIPTQTALRSPVRQQRRMSLSVDTIADGVVGLDGSPRSIAGPMSPTPRLRVRIMSPSAARAGSFKSPTKARAFFSGTSVTDGDSSGKATPCSADLAPSPVGPTTSSKAQSMARKPSLIRRSSSSNGSVDSAAAAEAARDVAASLAASINAATNGPTSSAESTTYGPSHNGHAPPGNLFLVERTPGAAHAEHITRKAMLGMETHQGSTGTRGRRKSVPTFLLPAGALDHVHASSDDRREHHASLMMMPGMGHGCSGGEGVVSSPTADVAEAWTASRAFSPPSIASPELVKARRGSVFDDAMTAAAAAGWTSLTASSSSAGNLRLVVLTQPPPKSAAGGFRASTTTSKARPLSGNSRDSSASRFRPGLRVGSAGSRAGGGGGLASPCDIAVLPPVYRSLSRSLGMAQPTTSVQVTDAERRPKISTATLGSGVTLNGNGDGDGADDFIRTDGPWSSPSASALLPQHPGPFRSRSKPRLPVADRSVMLSDIQRQYGPPGDRSDDGVSAYIHYGQTGAGAAQRRQVMRQEVLQRKAAAALAMAEMTAAKRKAAIKNAKAIVASSLPPV